MRAADDNIIYLEQSGSEDFLLHDEPSEDGLWKGIRMNTMVLTPTGQPVAKDEQDQAGGDPRQALSPHHARRSKRSGSCHHHDDNNVSLRT